MDTRKPDDKKNAEIEIGLLIPKTPNLSLRRLERVVSFRLPRSHRHDGEVDDLPDITPDLTAQLKLMWSLEDLGEERPRPE